MAPCRGCHRTRFHRARGLCPTCYERARHHGTLTEHPTRRLIGPRDFVDDYQHLRDHGLNDLAIAHRLGLTPSALTRRLQRYRRAGLLPVAA